MVVPPSTGKPLAVGELLPPLTAEGWLNGGPPFPVPGGVRLVLVDLWAHWCPYCRLGAPELVRLHRKYAGQGVAFVSLTNMPRQMVEAFVTEFGLTWSNGYGAGRDVVAALGFNPGMSQAYGNQAVRGYDVAPTIYLVGPDGRVRWCDRQGRYRHTDSGEWGRQIDGAIEQALASQAGANASGPPHQP